MSENAIVCHDVWKSYRLYHQRSHTLKEKVLSRRNRFEEFWAVKGVNLEVRAGTTLGIIGANGSGKSTLLKTMAGILSPTKGSVESVGTISPLLELGTGFHPDLTGKENLFLGGSLLGQTRRDIESRYDDIVAFAGIEPFMDTPVKNYSSGMYARLAFALAINVDPDTLIVDEVLAVGDESFQMRCQDRIAQLRREGRTIVLVSHSLATIRSLCQEAAWIDGGVLRVVGNTHHVTNAYLRHVHGAAPGDQAPAEGQRYGIGGAEITDVRIFSDDGAETGAVRTGERMTIRLSYRAAEALESGCVGVAVYRAVDGVYVFGQNSAEGGMFVPLDPELRNVELTIPDLPLLRGRYLVTVSLHDHSIRKIYDVHDRVHSFTVVDNPAMPVHAGLVHIPSQWKMTSPAAEIAR
ncbi:MAG: type transport system ATP-binding protein [Actinomycetota bacterium]|nr:type transport system ATP-binding protein [Actinomycetota bacterium]